MSPATTTTSQTGDPQAVSNGELAGAYHALELPSETPLEAVRAAFLTRIEREDFCIAAIETQSYDAIRRGTEGNPPEPSAVPNAAEQQCYGQEIDEFARGYFDLAPAARQQRWKELRTRWGHRAPARMRLIRLQPCLHLSLETLENLPPAARDLATFICEQLVAPPLERGHRRAAFFHAGQENPKVWANAAAELTKLAPEFAHLDTELLEQIRTWPGRHAREVKQRMRSKPIVVREEVITAAPVKVDKQGSNSGVGWSLAIALGLGLIRVLFSFNDKPSTKPYRPPANLNVPFSTEDTNKLLERINGKTIDNVSDKLRESTAEKLNGLRDEVYKILVKSDEELTEVDRNRLIMFGFGNGDEDLTKTQTFLLQLYDLREARRMWRHQHEEMAKKLASQANGRRDERRTTP